MQGLSFFSPMRIFGKSPIAEGGFALSDEKLYSLEDIQVMLANLDNRIGTEPCQGTENEQMP